MAELKMKVDYDPKISLGTIVETVTLLLAAGSAYVALTNADIRHDEQIKAVQQDVVRIDTAQRSFQNEMKTDLKDIKEAVIAIRVQQAVNSPLRR
jgi:GTPase